MHSIKRILFAEDSPRDAELTLAALAAHNLANTVVHVRDGADALDYLYRHGAFAGRTDEQPVVVLLDLKMPKVDGLEVLRRVRAAERTRRLPIVILTSSQEETDLTHSYDLGVNSYIHKPVSFEQFTQAVRQLGLYWLLLNKLPDSPGKTDGDAR